MADSHVIYVGVMLKGKMEVLTDQETKDMIWRKGDTLFYKGGVTDPDYQFVSGDSAFLPYVDESMDVVMACMAYHHFPDQEQFRNEAMRVLKPGGSLYISDPRFPLIVR